MTNYYKKLNSQILSAINEMERSVITSVFRIPAIVIHLTERKLYSAIR
jgi:hypothetical protein